MKRQFLLAALVFCSLATPALATGGKGMTWAKVEHNARFGVDKVGCANCDAYRGETACTTALPILCLRQDGSPVPTGLGTDFYNGWVGGHIATTPPIQGTALVSQVVADRICMAHFGADWRMAEFHDGKGGWNWYAFGNIRNDLRSWVRISDQPANCWNP